MKKKSIEIKHYVDPKGITKAKLRGVEIALLLNRVSDVSQKDGYSLGAQHRHGDEYITDLSYTLFTEYNIAETASKSHLRKNFDQMVQEIRLLASMSSTPVNLIVEKSDRLSRNFTSKETLQKLAKAGMLRIHYYKTKKIFDKNCSPEDVFHDDIETAVAKYAAANIGRESQKGSKEKAMEGVFPGRAPLGYKNKRIHEEQNRNKRGRAVIIVDPDERCVKAVKRIFELRAVNGLSYEGIKHQIIEENILPPEKVRSFSKTGVEKILQNKFYMGKFVWIDEEYDGSQEIIIPKEHLDIVFNTKRGKHTLRPRGIFSNFLTCSVCGCAILYDPKKKYIKSKDITRQFEYYHCSDGKRHHKQNSEKQVNISEEKIFAQFEAVLDSFEISESSALKISNYLKDEHRKIVDGQKKQIQRDQQAIKAFEKQEDDLLELLMSRTIDEVSYQRKLKQLREDKKILSSQIERVQSKFAAGFMLTSDSILELAKHSKSLWKTKNKEERVELLKLLLSNQQLNGKVVESTLHKPFKILGEIRDLEELAKKKLPKKEAFSKWCPGEDLNLQSSRHTALNRACLPICIY
ncbi:MAG: recombinase family protein [Halobacteriovoraceae bacterium]|nr:recombinase family protein [Halobacteriovoraceae bacterium]